MVVLFPCLPSTSHPCLRTCFLGGKYGSIGEKGLERIQLEYQPLEPDRPQPCLSFRSQGRVRREIADPRSAVGLPSSRLTPPDQKRRCKEIIQSSILGRPGEKLTCGLVGTPSRALSLPYWIDLSPASLRDGAFLNPKEVLWAAGGMCDLSQPLRSGFAKSQRTLMMTQRD